MGDEAFCGRNLIAYQWPIDGPKTNASTTNALGKTISTNVFVPKDAIRIEARKIAPTGREEAVALEEAPGGLYIR